MASGNNENDDPFEKSEQDFRIPSKYLNSFGFIDYKHDGSFPWTIENEMVPLSAEYTSITHFLAIDCEMVAVGHLRVSALGRVSIINEYGFCIYNTFVKPMEEITDYGTQYSGIRPIDLIDAPWSDAVVQEVASLVKGKVLIGHSIHNDLDVLDLNHHTNIRDTATYFKKRCGYRLTPSLKNLTKQYLKTDIQFGEHNSIQDAQATLKLYLLFREEWEKESLERRKKANLTTDTVTDISCMHVEPRQPDIFVDSESVFIRPNKVTGAYQSSEEYLDIQFRLLMEDFLRPLRQDVRMVKQHRKLENLYNNVRISQGCEAEGSTFEVRFNKSLLIPIEQNRLDDVDWDDPNIFLSGSLLLLSPDNFKTVRFAKVIDIAKNQQQDAYFLRLYVMFLLDGPNWTITDKQRFQMIESKAFFIPYEYTLNFLQVVELDTFPMKKYIVDAVTKSEITSNLLDGHQIDLSVLMNGNETNTKTCVNPLDFQSWPNASQLNLDPSQFEALQRALTQELTIIQGPPGTGKTHISLQIVKLFLTNQWLSSSPMLIVAYTNHALDQLLEQIMEFLTETIHKGNRNKAEEEILRIGGGCKSEIILPCTMMFKEDKIKQRKKIENEIKSLDKALFKVKDLDFERELRDQGILDFKLIPQIILSKLSTNKKSRYIFTLWNESYKEISGNVLSWFGLDEKSVEKKTMMHSINDGLFLLVCTNLITILNEKFPSIPTTLEELKNRHLYDSNLERQYLTRWGYYFYLIGQLAEAIKISRDELNVANVVSDELKHYRNQNTVFKQAKIIGMTTTGAVKYKKIVDQSLKPKIMLVEEAAHVLEAYVVASLTRHCQQLILIGDHKQLRPMLADHKLTENNLDVSLMERLVKNGIEQKNQNWTQLKLQHRMRPEIARMICPVIYNELDNHSDVEKYPNVMGCSKNLFFVHHTNPESRDHRSNSRFNKYEARYIIGLLSYFTECGYLPSQITVICMYMAQKTLIDSTLKHNMKLNQIEISTVDGYQGKENDVILLSLVRNNKENNVGFLKTDNRVCVALSRARQGLFIIGNMSILAASSDTWSQINQILVDTESIGTELPLHYPEMFKPHNTLEVSILEYVRSTKSRPSRRNKLISKKETNDHDKGRIPSNQHNSIDKLRIPSSQNNLKDKQRIPSSQHNSKNEIAQSVLRCRHARNGIVRNLTNDGKCMETTVKKLSCGHEILTYCCESITSVRCWANKIIQLPCGHEKDVSCRDSSTKNALCCTKITLGLKCGHSAIIPCGLDRSKVKCTVSKTETLPCGHLMYISCDQKQKPTKCGSTVKKKLECGHTVFVACHSSTNTKCSAKVTKSFSCGHKNTFPCHQQQQFCLTEITQKLSCGHSVKIACGMKDSQIKCAGTIIHRYPCGHEHRLACSHRPKKNMCGSTVRRKLPCGHTRDTACHQDPLTIRCEQLVAVNGCKKQIQCFKLNNPQFATETDIHTLATYFTRLILDK